MDLSSWSYWHRPPLRWTGRFPVRIHHLRRMQSLHHIEPWRIGICMANGRRSISLGICAFNGEVEGLNRMTASTGFSVKIEV